MTASGRVLVVGGTGEMGSAVVRALCADHETSWQIRVLTRNPGSARAEQLRDRHRWSHSTTSGGSPARC